MILVLIILGINVYMILQYSEFQKRKTYKRTVIRRGLKLHQGGKSDLK